jgi:recombinational DNA repair protein (RecF pathway)
LNRATEADRQLENLFDLSDRTLAALDAGEPVLPTIVRFELHTLAILGHAPQLTECVACSAALPAARVLLPKNRSLRAAFSYAAGGVVCDACLPGHREIARFGNDTILALQNFLSVDWRSGEATVLPTRAIFESRQLLNRLFQSLLDRPIDVAHLLDNLPQ